MHFTIRLLLTILALVVFVYCTTANPTFQEMNSFDEINQYENFNYKPITEYNLRRLRRGYYYVDDGYITAIPVSAAVPPIAVNRRQDDILDTGNTVRFTPIVKYKKTRTKRKKLFVPNFFG